MKPTHRRKQNPTYNKKKFPGVGRTMTGNINATVDTQQRSTTLLLKPTPMARCVGNLVHDYGQSCNFANGIDWLTKPRHTRSAQAVSRKTPTSVEAVSEEAQAMLVSLFSSANDATTHAKRKTLYVEDMNLVQTILRKHGLH